MQKEPVTPEQKQVEADCRAALTPEEMEYYEIHLHAKGRMIWQTVFEPDEPEFDGIEETGGFLVPPPDVSNYDMTTPEGCLKAAMAHAQHVKDQIDVIVEYDLPVEKAKNQRLRESAKALGKEHVL